MIGLEIILILFCVVFKSETKNLKLNIKTYVLHFNSVTSMPSTECVFRYSDLKTFSNWSGKSGNKNVSGREDDVRTMPPEFMTDWKTQRPYGQGWGQFVKHFRSHTFPLPVLCFPYPLPTVLWVWTLGLQGD